MGQRGRYVEGFWPGDPGGQTRRERTPGRYQAYVPEPIADHDIAIPAALSVLLTDAEAVVRELNMLDPARGHQMEALARQLLRQEALSSSRIEGLALSHKRISEASYDPRGSTDERAKAVLSNIEAMHEAIRVGAAERTIEVATIVGLHRTLMTSTNPGIAGKIRDRQNWIGGHWHTPLGAEFIPPPPEEVEPLMADLAEFVNRDDLPAVFQAALAHAQFETIHPFADGNGRVGRCLIHVVLKRRGVAKRQVPPISLLMAADVDGYVKALTAYRDDREEEWSSYFARTAIEASTAAEELAGQVRALQGEWREMAGARRGSAAARIIDLLPGRPVIDVASASRLAEVSDEAARNALNRLEERRVVKQVGNRSWGRVWEARGLWQLLDSFERRVTKSTL